MTKEKTTMKLLMTLGLLETAYIIDPNTIRYYIADHAPPFFIKKLPFSLEDYLG